MDDDTRLDRLLTSRNRLETLLAVCEDGSKAAALSRELRALEDEVDLMAGPKAGSDLDDLANRRASRLAETEGSGAPAVHHRGGRSGSDRSS